jgi:4-azaleucine resistance transporter AzlC
MTGAASATTERAASAVEPGVEERAAGDLTAVDATPRAVSESRRQLTRDAMAIAAYALPVGMVYGLATLQAHFTLLDVVASCLLVLAGGAQFAAAGLVKDGAPWLAIVGVTLLINARHLLYSAAIAPYMAERPRRERAFLAHFLTDEAFALSLAHFRRIGRFDAPGYWVAAMVVMVPWTLGSTIGFLAGGAVDTRRLGLDVAFPAAMAGLSLGMVSGRRDAAAALGAVAVAVPVGLAGGASLGLVAGAVVGPFFGLAVPASPAEKSGAPETPEPSAEAGLP